DAHKTLRLSVRQGGLIMVKSPASVSLDSICGFVRSHLGWIEKKRGGMASRKTAPASFRDGGTVWIQGKARVIRIIPPRAAPRLEEGALLLPCSLSADAADGNGSRIKRAYLAWRQAHAQKILAERLDSLAERAREMLGDDLSPSSLSVRPLRGRWGSCGRDGMITLATALVELPNQLIDHVICHELCHLRAMDHGKSFHALLERLTPGERDLRRRIREWCTEHPRIERDRPL
ncbi:MAG: M48 family metallopeptidase, partial [Mailhella sp.]|nr:M48 family metallopeptidase [Mailhella sp.]